MSSNELVPLEPSNTAMDKFAFSVEELIHDVDTVQDSEGFKKKRWVCLCGHTYQAHKESDTGLKSCRPNARTCHCPEFNPVLETTNLRVFMRVSMGNGTLHALSQGVRALMEKGGVYVWLPDSCYCYVCRKTDVKIVPVVVSTDGYRVGFKEAVITGRVDIFLCQECNFEFEKNGTVRKS
jgi:hypothetical protein